MKTAIVYDSMSACGVAERVIKQILELHPSACQAVTLSGNWGAGAHAISVMNNPWAHVFPAWAPRA